MAYDISLMEEMRSKCFPLSGAESDWLITEVERLTADRARMRDLLTESMQFCQRIDVDGDPLNIYLSRKIHMELVESALP